jgi:hypothetical protein
MRAGRPLAGTLLVLALPAAQAQPGGPVEAAVRFHQARLERPCSEVWALYSRDSQARMREQSHRLARERGARPDEGDPVGARCRRIGKVKPDTARLVRQVGPEAVVAATFRGAPPRHEWDFSARFRQYTEELDLIREDGLWKAELPRRKIGSSQARLSVPAGVVHWRRDPVEGAIHHKLEVTVASRVPRDALDAVLRDGKTWAAALPSFKSIEVLPGGKERALLAFADPFPPIPVTVSLRGRPLDPKARWTSLEWTAEHDVEAPIYMKGSWNLEPNADGTTRLNLTLVVNPRHWPRYERLFPASAMAKSLDVLQTAAGKKP